ncbi:MAG: hypothetical protein ACFFDO_03160 [Candidatus Thorarchaeota archaeon]
MIKIDIILPSFNKPYKYQKYQRYQIFPFPSLIGSWFPVWYNRKLLKNMGIQIRFLNFFNFKYKKLRKIVGLDNRIIGNIGKNYDSVRVTTQKAIIPILKKLRKKIEYLIYFDNGDGTGHTQFEVLPYVDRYLKKQILKDRSLYLQFLYKKRLFTDFYKKKYNLKPEGTTTKLHPINSKYEHKVGLSWNFAYRDYRPSNEINKIFYGFYRIPYLKYSTPSKNRKLLFSANYSIKTGSNLIDFQRKELFKFLKRNYKMNQNISIGRIPKKIYLKTQKNSKAIFSPYGWGELCYRDFEVFISGAALLKPDMDHLETWPNLYKKYKTYIPISWEIEEWDTQIPKILTDEDLLLDVAKNGQNLYKSLWTEQGRKIFCERFISMVSPS